MTYDPVPYWLERGRHAGPLRPAEAQEQAVVAVLDEWGLGIRSILDVGCGNGRLGALIARRFPTWNATYTGLDVSPERLALARRAVPQGHFVEADFLTWRGRRRYDLVVASEFLMHVQPRDVRGVVLRLRGYAEHYLLTIDWVPTHMPPVVAAWNFPHDYDELLGPAVDSARVGEQIVRLTLVAR